MEEKSFERRVKDLEDAFYRLDSESSVPIDIVNEIEELLRISPDNLEVLDIKALMLINAPDSNTKEIVEIYEHMLKIAPPDSIYAKEAREIIDIYENFNSDNSYCSKSSDAVDSLMEFVSVKLIVGIKLIIIAILAIFILNKYNVMNHENVITEKLTSVATTKTATNDDILFYNDDFIDLKINKPTNYNYKTKNEIYDIRKSYVSKSKFAKRNYEPNEAVFGSIVDYKPWWGLISCDNPDYHGDYHERIEGPSKVSVQMNNPDALVQVSLPYLIWGTDYNREYCTSEYSKFIPYSLKFSKKYNAYVLKYELTRAFLNYRTNINNKTYRYPLQLSGLNARDFGYNYVYAYNTTNIKMFSYSDFDMTNSIVTFADYVHLGGSCKYKDGCNNISPMQDGLMFRVTELPATISLKLWKNYPSSTNEKPDLYYQIVFDEK